MKSNIARISVQIVTLTIGALNLYGQGTFQNLDFENPVLPLIRDSSFEVPITNALPGWAGYLGVFQVDRVVYNTVSLGAAAISLQGPGSGLPAIAGNYSVVLQSAFGVAPDGTAAVGQTGQIPVTARSLRFYGSTDMQVTFIGQSLTLFGLGIGPNYQIVGADISGFAGQTGELKFLIPDLTPLGSTSSYLDNIVFSSQSIPEPSVLGLFGLGALLFAYRSRRLT